MKLHKYLKYIMSTVVFLTAFIASSYSAFPYSALDHDGLYCGFITNNTYKDVYITLINKNGTYLLKDYKLSARPKPVSDIDKVPKRMRSAKSPYRPDWVWKLLIPLGTYKLIIKFKDGPIKTFTICLTEEFINSQKGPFEWAIED